MILCGVFQLILGEKLNCNFKDVEFNELSGSLYTCDVTSLENVDNNMIITGFIGPHMYYKINNNVRAIQIKDQKTKFIPVNLGNLFFNLIVLRIESSQLIEIKSQDFHKMQDLEHFSFWNNKLTSLPSDAFSTLPKLKEIYLAWNQIEELPFGLFINNSNLEIIHLSNNKIKYLGAGLFGGLVKLNKVYANGNICVNRDFIGNTAIQQLKQYKKVNCNLQNDEFDLKLSDMMKQLKYQTVSEKLRESLSDANERENALKKVNAELLETTELMVPKMQNEINELNSEIFQLKEQRRMEQIAFIEIRSKLKEANEKMANCQLNLLFGNNCN